ncbi:hypothetical protein [Novosphingobium sp. ST904]|uniref:hypothetical protein n=2 Tax=Novosphingobium sp. ST904 TaxID=1684385 RepID=UPI0010505B50|nr:hypothetical protein [Novosphingobium sp. ST904]
MRPYSMVKFDRFYLGSLVLGVVNALLAARDTLSAVSVGFVLGVQAFSMALMILLWFLISRRANNAAKWVLTVLTAIGLLVMIPTLPILAAGSALDLIFMAAVTALQVTAVVNLFRADSRAWFARKGIVLDDETIFS